MLRKELQNNADSQKLSDASEEVIYKIDIPANRYDMLCVEGIARALNIFAGKITPPRYRLADMTGRQMQRMVVRPETALVRPFVVCAVLRGVRFDPVRYNSFIDLQDKLHQNLCRQRSLVAIGTHDLATVQGPFTYEALPPEDIRFVPLKQSREFDARELLAHYAANDQKLKRFVPIIQGSVVYPVILDSNRTVLSLPPVINGARSAISLDTRDVFIECTATDLTKARVVLNTVCAMFSEYCATPFEVEPVEVVDAAGRTQVCPDLAPRSLRVAVEYVNSCTGLGLGAAEMASLLDKMQLQAEPAAGGAELSVSIPVTRSDILHGAPPAPALCSPIAADPHPLPDILFDFLTVTGLLQTLLQPAT
jgi:phenylalanyl-tRNA synthetase beta chain